jgi:hypothetical protein
MRMKLQALIPTVKHTEETDLGSKMPGIASDLKQGLGAGVKEQVEDESLVLEDKGGQFVRQCKDNVEVRYGQQFCRARRQPFCARVALALGAVPIAACNGVHSITCLMGSFSLWGVRR